MTAKLHSWRYFKGVTLVELMVAMVIGLLIVLAIGSVYIGNKNTYRTSESVARLQEESRFALMSIRYSLQHAGYFGRVDSPVVINGRRNSGSDLANLSGDCAPGWYIDLDRIVQSPNTAGGNPYSATCLDGSSITRAFQPGTDILIVRRADSAIAIPAADPGRVFLRADVQRGELFVAGGTPPVGYGATVEDRPLITEMFYITPNEELGPADPDGPDGIPTLRRLFLTTWSSAPALRSEKIARNIEQFQIQLGEDVNGDDVADRFVNPQNATPGIAVSVRLWLLIRSETREPDFTDTNTYQMGDQSYTPPAGTRNFRRILATQTIDLRNN